MRDSYIDPRVVAHYQRGKTISRTLKRLAANGSRRGFADREAIERAVIRLLG